VVLSAWQEQGRESGGVPGISADLAVKKRGQACKLLALMPLTPQRYKEGIWNKLFK
jgi:hypothetical protein